MKKKWNWIALVLVVAICLTACAGKKAPAHCGTWAVSSISLNGVEFTGEQLQAMGLDDVQDFRVILTSDGKAYLVDNGQVEQSEWRSSDDGLQIDSLKATYQENQLALNFGEGILLHLKKESNSQAVPNVEASKPNETIAPETTPPTQPETIAPTVPETTVPAEPAAPTVPETTAPAEPDAPSGIRPEFREAMDSYEAFYDEYCDLLAQYSKNPTDLSLLSKYSAMLGKAEEMDKKFEAWDEGEMSNEELKYYLDVMNRVQKRMVDMF